MLVQVGKKEAASQIAADVAKISSEYCSWYSSLSARRFSSDEMMYQLYQLNDAVKILEDCGDTKNVEKYDMALQLFGKMLQERSYDY